MPSTAPSTSEKPLKTVIVGHVDHGKSTLVGRLLYETDSLEEGKYEKVKTTCEKRGVPFEWAFLMDALQAERNQNITIDTAQIWFETDLRPYTIIDAPGHKEFLKNMVTGAAQADAALLLIAADEGVQEQSRRHCYMLSMLGIDEVTVVVNKMDLVDYDQERYEHIVEEYTEFLDQIGVEPRAFVPTSARDGDNVVDEPTENMPWWQGNSVLDELDDFPLPNKLVNRPLRFPIQDIYRFDNRRILAGRIESGQLEVGQELVFTPHHKSARVETIERWNAPKPDSAEVGESIGITLDQEIFVERGHVASDAGQTNDEDSAGQPTQTTQFRANIFWLGKEPLEMGEPYKLKLGPIAEECSVEEIERIMDGANLEPIEEARDHISRYDVAEVLVETRRPISVDRYADHPTVGRFVIVDDYDVAGGGIIVQPVETNRRPEETLRRVSSDERSRRAGHRGAVLELHAPNANRLAVMLERQLFERGVNAYFMDHVPGGVEERHLAEFLSKVGTVALLPIDVEGSTVEVVVDGEETLEFDGAATDGHVEPILEELLPLLRDAERQMDVEAKS